MLQLIRLFWVLLIGVFSVCLHAQIDFSSNFQSACPPFLVQFQNSSAVGGSSGTYYWDFGDGTYSTIENPIKIYPIPGKYDVKLVVNGINGQFSDSLTKVEYIEVFELPKADFNILTDLRGCHPLNAQIQDLSVPKSSPISTWLWDFGNGQSSQIQNPIATYTASTNTSISLYITDQSNCSADTVIPIEVFVSTIQPNAMFDIDSTFGCQPPHPVNFTNLSTGDGPLTYIWHFDDGDTSYLENPYHTYNSYDTFYARISVIDTFNCKKTYGRNIFVRDVIANFNYDTIDYCKPKLINFIDSSSNFAIDWLWSFGDGDSSGFQNSTHTYMDEGTYNVSLKATDINGCSSVKSKSISVIQNPKANFDTATTFSCIAPFQTSFTSTSLNAIDYLWDFGDGNQSQQQNATHTYALPGKYDISLTITDTNNCSHNKFVNENVIIEHIQVDFNVDTTPYCSPSYIFIDQTNPIPNSWYWDFGDGDTSTFNSPTHTYLDTGAYTIYLKVTGEFCSDSVYEIFNVIDSAKLYALFSADSLHACEAPFIVNFTDSSKNPMSWLWDFGDGGSSIDQNPSYTYSDPGIYSIRLSIFDSTGCTDLYKLHELIIIETGFVPFNLNYTCSEPYKITLEDNNIEATDWFWEFGDGQTSTQKNPQHTYALEGDYEIKLTVSNNLNSCEFEFYDSISIRDVNLAFQVIDNQICNYQAAEFINNSTGIDSSVWLYGDGYRDTIIDSTYHYPGPGFYTVQLIGWNKSCIDTLTKANFIEVLGPSSGFDFDINCASPLTVNFHNQSIIAQSYIWDFGDGSSSSTQHPSHNYTSQGVFPVTLITNNFATGCQDTMIKNVYMDPPLADFAATTQVCYSDTVVFLDFSPFAEQWHWDFGDGTTSNLQNPKHFYESPDTYSVTLIITANLVCHDTITKTNYVKVKAPKSEFIAIADCDSIKKVTFTSTSVGADSWQWDFGDGQISSIESPVHTYTNSGNFVTSLKTYNSQTGCNHTFFDTIKIEELKADFFLTDSAFCFGNSIQFHDTSSFAEEYLWYFGDGDTSHRVNPFHNYDSIGNYDVSLIVTNRYGCKDTMIKANYLELLGPKSSFTDSFDCIDFYTAHFKDNSDSADAWLWYFGDGINSVSQDNSHTFNSINAYNVSLQTVNNTTGCTHIYTKKVQLNIPKADYDFSDSVICELDEVLFHDQSTFPVSWNWTLSNIDYSTLENPEHIYDTTGTFITSLRYIDVNGCSDSITHPSPIHVNPIPNIDFQQDTAIGCLPFEVNFLDLSSSDTSLMSWLWTFSNTESSTLQNPTHTFKQKGHYNISLAISNAKGCYNEITKSDAVIITKPLSAFHTQKGSYSYCYGDTVNFLNTNLLYNQNINANSFWTFKDSTFSNIAEPSHLYQNTGLYDVVHIVTDSNTCKDTTIKLINIQEVEAKFFTNDTTYKSCPPLFINFGDSSISYIDYWEWDFGDNTGKAFQAEPSHNYTYAGVFDVKLIIKSSGNCWDTIVMDSFIIVDGPFAQMQFNPKEGCKPLDVLFTSTNQVNVSNFFYNFGDGTNYGLNDSSLHAYEQTGVFFPALWLQDSVGCSYYLPSYDSIYIVPVNADFSVTNPYSGCRPFQANFVDASYNANYWEWHFGDGDTMISQSSNHIYTSSGNFDITLIVNDSISGCKDTFTRINAIDVFDIEANFISNSYQGCNPFELTFNDASTTESFVTNWFWDFGNGQTSSTPIPPDITYTNPNDTTYNVTLWIKDNDNCEDSISRIITLNQYPSLSFITDTTKVCPETPILFTNLSSADSGTVYQWSMGDSSIIDAFELSHDYSYPGLYTIILSAITPAGCDTMLVKENLLEILEKPNIYITGSQSITINEVAQLNASGGQSYEWTPKESLSNPYIPNPIADPDDTTIYTVFVIDSNLCHNYDSVTIIVVVPENPMALIPDAFSPNNDGQNDILTIIDYDIANLSYFRVYNRWGQILFETNDITGGWDGNYKGEPQDIGTYIYLIVGYSNDGEKVIKKGDVTLIR